MMKSNQKDGCSFRVEGQSRQSDGRSIRLEPALVGNNPFFITGIQSKEIKLGLRPTTETHVQKQAIWYHY